MVRQPVKSSNIKSVGYDSERKVMQVEFQNGSVYDYAGVDPKHHDAFVKSDSKGSFLHNTIRNNFKFKLVKS